MWFYKKKDKPKDKPKEELKEYPRTMDIFERLVERKVTTTYVLVTMQDKRNIVIKFYSKDSSQYCNRGRDGYIDTNGNLVEMREPEVGELYISDSLYEAQCFIKNLHNMQNATIVDDLKSPKKALVGTPVKAQILRTEEHVGTFNESYVARKGNI